MRKKRANPKRSPALPMLTPRAVFVVTNAMITHCSAEMSVSNASAMVGSATLTVVSSEAAKRPSETHAAVSHRRSSLSSWAMLRAS